MKRISLAAGVAALIVLAGCNSQPTNKVVATRSGNLTASEKNELRINDAGEPAIRGDMEPSAPGIDPVTMEPKVPPMYETTNLAQPERDDPNWIAAHDLLTKPHGVPISCKVPEGTSYRCKIFHGDKQEKILALTFDDGPRPEYTPRLLKVLDDLHIKATFFVVGKMANKHPELVKMISDAGHVIANHSYSHPTLSRLSPEDIRTELEANNMLLEKITGKRPIFFRPPGGQVNSNVIKSAEECGLMTVFWTNDPGDYAQPGTKKLLNKTLAHIGPGGIIVFHDGPEETLDILPSLVSICRDNGYKFVTMTDILESLPELPKAKLTDRSVAQAPAPTTPASRPEPN